MGFSQIEEELTKLFDVREQSNRVYFNGHGFKYVTTVCIVWLQKSGAGLICIR